MGVKATQKDNNTFSDKVMLRQTALRLLNGKRPVIVETHGGRGDVWSAVYNHVEDGVVFEKSPEKALELARQRPSWAVYQADCVGALELGAGSHLEANLLDVDPYGDPWPAIKAFMGSERPLPGKLVIVVNDGLRQALSVGRGWAVGTTAPMVERFGNDLWGKYLEICRELMEDVAADAGYRVSFWDGYYCGTDQKLTHYVCLLEKV